MSIYLVIIKHIPIPKNIIIMYLYIISQAFFGTIETIYISKVKMKVGTQNPIIHSFV